MQKMVNLGELHPTQREYAIAKAERDSIKERVNQETREFEEELDELSENYEENEEKIGNILDVILKIEEEHGLLQANEKLREKEKKMVEWMFRKLEEREPERMENVKILREKWNKNPRLKDKVVDVAFRYSPSL